MNLLVIITSSFLILVSSYEDDKALITKNYILVPSSAPLSFVQVSTDFSQKKYIDRPEVVFTINVIRVKHVRWFIHLYWFTDQSRGNFSLTKISRSERETITFSDTTPANSVIKDLDIHPTLDLVYLATGGGGLVEYNTISMEYRQLKGGSYVALQLDSMNNLLYYMDCSDATKPVLGKLDVASSTERGSYSLNSCYKMFEIDFTTGDIYLVTGKILYKTNLSNLETFASWTKIKTFDSAISSIALGTEYLYLVLDAGNTIFYVSRTNDQTKSSQKIQYLFSVAVYEGPELEPEPETTLKSEVITTTTSIVDKITAATAAPAATTTKTTITAAATTTTKTTTTKTTATKTAPKTSTTAATKLSTKTSTTTTTKLSTKTSTGATATDENLDSTKAPPGIPSGTQRMNASLKMFSFALYFGLVVAKCMCICY